MKNILNWTLLACWAVCWLSGLAAIGGVSLEYAMPMYVAGAAMALVWGVKLLSGDGGTWVPAPLHWPLVALLAYTAARYGTAPLRHEAAVDLLLMGLCVAVYGVTACTFYRSSTRVVMLGLLGGVLVAQTVYGYWQAATGADRVFWFIRDAQYHGRASGSFICPNHLAGMLEVGAMIFVAQLLLNPKPLKSLEGSVIVKLLEATVLAVAVFGLYITKSRGGWLAVGAGAFVFWFWAWRTGWLRPRVADALLIGLLLAASATLAIPSVRERLLGPVSFNPHYTFRYDILHVRQASFEGRDQMAASSWQMFRDHPWFGVGPGAWRWFFPQYREAMIKYQPEYAHNDLLQFAAEYGIAGVALALAALGAFLWQAIRLCRRDNTDQQRAIALGCLLASAAVFVHSAMDFSLHMPANAVLVATLLGLLAGTRDATGHFQRRRFTTPGRIGLGVTALLASAGIGWGAFQLCSAQRHMINGINAGLSLQWNTALQDFHEATVHDPFFAAPHAGIGDVFRHQLREQHSPTNTAALAAQSLAGYEASLQRNPRDSSVWTRIAEVHDAAGNTHLAEAAYQHAFALDPNNVYHWVAYARFLRQTGRHDDAIRLLEKACTVHDPAAGRLLREWLAENRH